MAKSQLDTGVSMTSLNTCVDVDADYTHGQVTTKPTLWLDVTDILNYAELGNTTVSGIQRVVVNLIERAGMSQCTVVPVALERNANQLYAADLVAVQAISEVLQAGTATPSEIKELWARVWTGRHPADAREGDVFVLSGAFWIYDSYDLFARLRRNGVRLVLYIYDLIQLTYPQYVNKGANRLFICALLDLLAEATLVLTISMYVRDELRLLVSQRLAAGISVESMLLPTQLPTQHGLYVPDPKAKAVLDRDFVLVVATLEVRKNHVYLLRVWDRLRREGLDVPNLVFVGKWGWDVKELESVIVELDALDRWLFIFNGLSDAGLAYFYERCLMTAYVSFAEGFGLPVAESLAFGKPCVAANRTSIPEVGGDLIRLVDPDDLAVGVDVFREVLSDREGLKGWARRIRADFKPRTWESFCQSYYEAVDAHAASAARVSPEGNVRLDAGQLYGFGNAHLRRLSSRSGSLLSARMARVSGWHPLDEVGCWAEGSRADLRLSTRLDPGTDVNVFMLARARPGRPDASVTIEAGADPYKIAYASSGEVAWIAPGRVGSDRVLAIRISTEDGMFHPRRGATCSFGLSGIGFVERGDLAGRLSILEAAFSWPLDDPPVPSTSRRDYRPLINARLGRAPAYAAPYRTTILALARHAGRRRIWSSVIRNYGRLFRWGGLDAKQWVQLGHALNELGDHEAAAGAYQSALDISPDHTDAHNFLRHQLAKIEGLSQRNPTSADG